MLRGIDVSSHQGTINWNNTNVDFAIIRLGYGDDIESQDDIHFMDNVNGCMSKQIPFGVYLYSYAKNLSGGQSIESEIAHCKRLLSKLSQKPFCVYIDMEDSSTEYIGKSELTKYALEFCKKITEAGYKAGVYANENWFKNFLNVNEISSNGYSIWCAKYSNAKPRIDSDFDIWQYSSSGSVLGLNGNVDMNYMYNDIRNTTSVINEKTTDEIAQEVINGLWGNGNDRKTRLTEAGYDYAIIQNKVNELVGTKKSTDEIAKEVIAGKWGNGNDRKTALEKAGYNYNTIQSKVNELVGGSSEEYYVIKSGDTLSSISKKFGSTINQIADWNAITNVNLIYPGRKIRVK